MVRNQLVEENHNVGRGDCARLRPSARTCTIRGSRESGEGGQRKKKKKKERKKRRSRPDPNLAKELVKGGRVWPRAARNADDLMNSAKNNVGRGSARKKKRGRGGGGRQP